MVSMLNISNVIGWIKLDLLGSSKIIAENIPSLQQKLFASYSIF